MEGMWCVQWAMMSHVVFSKMDFSSLKTIEVLQSVCSSEVIVATNKKISDYKEAAALFFESISDFNKAQSNWQAVWSTKPTQAGQLDSTNT